MYVVLWSDYEPFQSDWGDWTKQNFWESSYDKGYPQKSVYMAGELIEVSKDYNVPVTWGIFACQPFFQWVDYLQPFLEYTNRIGHNITVHPHWLKWTGKIWERNMKLSSSDLSVPLEVLPKLKEHSHYCNLVRNGWNTQVTAEGHYICAYYESVYKFDGIGDTRKTDKDFIFDKKFLHLPYDTDSMNDKDGKTKEKWERYFTKAIKGGQKVFHWWFHIHEVSPGLLQEMLDFSLDLAKKNNVKLEFKTVGEIYKCLQ